MKGILTEVIKNNFTPLCPISIFNTLMCDLFVFRGKCGSEFSLYSRSHLKFACYYLKKIIINLSLSHVFSIE